MTATIICNMLKPDISIVTARTPENLPDCERIMERRNFKRHQTRIAIAVLARGGRMKAQLDNLSVTGCRIECQQNWLDKGEFVRLLLPGGLEVEGQIAWIMRSRLGVQFADTLYPAIVRKLGFE